VRQYRARTGDAATRKAIALRSLIIKSVTPTLQRSNDFDIFLNRHRHIIYFNAISFLLTPEEKPPAGLTPIGVTQTDFWGDPINKIKKEINNLIAKYGQKKQQNKAQNANKNTN
jgi:hypothetical protein